MNYRLDFQLESDFDFKKNFKTIKIEGLLYEPRMDQGIG